MDQSTDYWSMSDSELELLAIRYNIPPISRAGAHGEIWYVDRDRVIHALLRRDNALNIGKASPALRTS
jgi:hypothetical protein